MKIVRKSYKVDELFIAVTISTLHEHEEWISGSRYGCPEMTGKNGKSCHPVKTLFKIAQGKHENDKSGESE